MGTALRLLRSPLGRALLLAGLAAVLPVPGLAHPDSFAPLVRQESRQVVHIKTRAGEGDGEEMHSELFGPFRPPEMYRGSGSGFIVSADGLVVTNSHVIADAEVIEVVTDDGATYEAEVVGIDDRTDLALLRVPAQGLHPVRFGDSSRLEVGDWVVAIGNPLGLARSVTAGIISAKGRNIFEQENLAYGEFIQTDAAINPGNSGGPLFNLEGQVVGVNTAISSRGYGIGFAVPSNLVVEIVEQLRRHGRVVRGWLGVVIQRVTPEWAGEVGLPPDTRGILVNDIVAGAPAARSPLKKGDVILSYDGRALEKVPQLQKLVAFTPPETPATLEVLRRNAGDAWGRREFQVKIGHEPEEERTASAGRDLLERLGMSLSAITDAVRRQHDIGTGQGIRIDSVGQGGLAEEIGLAPGDIILEADRQQVGSPEELLGILEEAPQRHVPLLVQRGSRTLFLTVPGTELQ